MFGLRLQSDALGPAVTELGSLTRLAFAHLAMKTKRLVPIVLLMVAVVTFSFWLGYSHGSSRAVAVTVASSPRMIVGHSRLYPRNTFSAFRATDATSVPAMQTEQR